MADQGIKIVERGGVYHLSGVLNEYADLSPLLTAKEPLVLNMALVSRLNSIGIRNLLKFLSDWGGKPFDYEQCPSEFVDQINMIPALLGVKNHGQIRSFFVPYECPACEHEADLLGTVDEYKDSAATGALPTRPCPECGAQMTVLTDSFFVFLNR